MLVLVLGVHLVYQAVAVVVVLLLLLVVLLLVLVTAGAGAGIPSNASLWQVFTPRRETSLSTRLSKEAQCLPPH